MCFGFPRLNLAVVGAIAIAALNWSSPVWSVALDGSPEATSFTWSPTSPEIGELVAFVITGHVGDIRAEWDFGENGCAGYPQIQTCEPLFSNCHDIAFKFASGGNKTVEVTVKDPTSGAVLGTASRSFMVQDVGSCDGTCTYSVNPPNWSFPPEGGSLTISVSTQAGCAWSASTVNPWITLNQPTSGTGSGSVSYDVAANAGVSRSGSISIENQTHSVFQLGCAISISPAAREFPWQGGSGIVTVSAAPDCDWSVSTSEAWVTLTSPASGTGPGSVSYDVMENQGDQRSSVVWIGDKIHTVTQSAPGPCELGSVPDDGSVENGYGWGTGEIFVQRFTPDSYPFVYTDVCTAFTQAGGDSTLSFDVLLFDDDGPGGGPGTLLGAVPAAVSGVPAWLDHTFASVDVVSAGVLIDDGSVFIGVGWDESAEIAFYVAADESPGTPTQSGYFSSSGAEWDSVSSAFPDYRSLMVRADGFSPIDGDWDQVVGSVFGGGNGFGDPSNSVVQTMEAFDGALYAGTKNQYGAEVNFTFDGENWFLGNSPGFNSPGNDAISCLIQFDGQLYASTLNPLYGTQVWRAADPLAWVYMEGTGFGDHLNASAPSGSVFHNKLYLGTEHIGGCEIWRTTDGVTWTQVHTNGFGSSLNESAESMVVFNNELYVGTRNVGGAEVWKSLDGIAWFSVITGGFVSASNDAITHLAVFDNVLYAGVSNTAGGAQVWRSANGSGWQQVVGDGFGNPDNAEFDAFTVGDLGLVAAVSGSSSPGTVWQSADGVAWSVISSPGFNEPDNEAIGALQYWGDRIYAGTSNPASGCEIWRGGRHPLFEDGFESGDTGAWGAAVP